MVKLEFRIYGSYREEEATERGGGEGPGPAVAAEDGSLEGALWGGGSEHAQEGEALCPGQLGVHQSVSRAKGTDAANTPVNPTSHMIFKCPTGRTVG